LRAGNLALRSELTLVLAAACIELAHICRHTLYARSCSPAG